MNISQALVEHVLNTKYEDIPKRAIDMQKRSLADAISVMLAATTACPACGPFIDYALSSGDSPVCTVLGTGEKASPANAAMANGALGHALDFEDSSAMATLHPNAVPTPVMLALAEVKGGVSGKELISALALASDIAIRLSLGCREDLSKYGWYMPPVFGSMAAVLAGCRLMGLDYGQTMDALACNLFQATGSAELINSTGSFMRSVRDGFGARAAITSVLLAEKGARVGFEEPFEGSKGFFAAYTRGSYDPTAVVNNLGKEYYGEELTIKLWPSCHGTHCGIQSIMEIMEENRLHFEDILSAHVSISEFCKNILMEPRAIKNRPQTSINAKFSIPYTLGLAARRGRVTLEDFMDDNLCDEDIYAFAERVSYDVNPELLKKCDSNVTTLTLNTTKGTFVKTRAKAVGDPELPPSEKQFEDKFKSCTRLSRRSLTEEEIDTLYTTLRRVEELEDVRDIIKML